MGPSAGKLNSQFALLDKPAVAPKPPIRDSARNAVRLADEHHFRSLAFPLIGAGSGGFNQEKAQAILLSELEALESPIEATLTIFTR